METIEAEAQTSDLCLLESLEPSSKEDANNPDIIELQVNKKFDLKCDYDLECVARELFQQGATVKYDFKWTEDATGNKRITSSQLIVNDKVVKEKHAVGAHEHGYYDKIACLVQEYKRAGMPEEPLRTKATSNISPGLKRGRIGKQERAEILKHKSEGKKVEEIAKLMNRRIEVIDALITESNLRDV